MLPQTRTESVYARRSWIPANNRGVMLTLDLMAALVRDPSSTLRAEAASIASGVPPDAFPLVLREWLAAHVVQEADPYNVELVRSPDWSLAIIQERGQVAGDCDDVATLGAAIGLAAGFLVRFVVLAWGETYSHVYAEIQAPGPPPIWYELDIHRPPAGEAPAPDRELVVYPGRATTPD